MNANPARRRSDESGVYLRPESVRALIVDDDSNYRSYITALARHTGFAAEEAEDGLAALSRIHSGCFDLIVVDQEMPRMKGLELIAAIRASESGSSSYALMLTGREDLETKIEALAAGFDDFLRKAESEAEIVAKFLAARRVIIRQRTLDLEARRMYGLATRDELTGVFNRRYFVEETERLLCAGTPFNLILFDLDGFKKVNDTFGHLAGDGVLRDVGALFHAGTRPEDLIARYGGDEFVMVVTELQLADCLKMAERLSGAIRSLQWVSGTERFGIDVSSGTSTSRLLSSPSLSQLIEAADHDLYKNKWMRRQAREARGTAPPLDKAGKIDVRP